MKKTNIYLALATSFALVHSASAVVPLAQLPSIKIDSVVPDSKIQTVEDIPDQSRLAVLTNSLLLNQKMNIPGWNQQTGGVPNTAEILKAFAVRTTAHVNPANQNESLFYVGNKVGRSGIWELEKPGDYFAIVNGRPLKGLTIKGYGGNAAFSKPQQPDGSLTASEAAKDTQLSKILIEKNIPTYLGALTVVRPDKTGWNQQANYIRLSRTSLRMNDLIDRTGPALRATVDHLRALITDEIGHEPDVTEFTQWLISETARTLAAKEFIGFKASNTNKDNLGIGELVDFGEASYDPLTYKPGSDTIGGAYGTSGLRTHLVSATNAIAKEYGLTINAEIDFNSIYEYTMSDLKAADASRIEIDKASKSDLMALGLSAQVVNDIVQAQSSKTLGILLVNEFTNNPRYPISDSDRSILLSKTTTSFVKLSNGSLLAQVVFDEVGGADGVREIIKESVAHAGSGTPAEIQTAVTKTFSAKIKHGFEAQSLAKKLIETKMHANFASIKAEFDATGRLSVTPRCVGIF